MIKKIAIFDFDGTLIDSPKNTFENRVLWEKKKDDVWGHLDEKGEYTKAWWSKPESLDSSVFDIKAVPHVKQRLLEHVECTNTFTCVCTGRIQMFSSICKNILRENGIPNLDGYYLSDSYSTLEFKLKTFNDLVDKHPNVEYIEIWEDRPTHVEVFRLWGSFQTCEVVVHQVDTGEIMEADIFKPIEEVKKDYLELVQDISDYDKYDLFDVLSDSTFNTKQLMKFIGEEFHDDNFKNKEFIKKLFEMRTDIRLFKLLDRKGFEDFVFYR